MAISGPEVDKPRAIHFQLRYITTHFDFRSTQISVSDPARKMDFLLRKRVPEDAPLPPLAADDGFVSITCERDMTERIRREAVSSGQLSIKKGAVRNVHDEMFNHLLRTLRLIRWRANSRGGAHPIRSGVDAGFRWSHDAVEWKPVADCLSWTIDGYMVPQWSSEAEQFVGAEVSGELDEPLGQELLREAWTNRDANPRSCIVLAVAAAEVGFKQFASKAFPDAAWIMEGLQSPPLVKMLTELFPWSKLKVQIKGKDLTPPNSVTTTLTTAVKLRNAIVHARVENLNRKTVNSVLTAVRDLLYFLDVAQGQEWALYYLSAEARKHFPQITSWPLLITPVF
jgi:hypothetical protein